MIFTYNIKYYLITILYVAVELIISPQKKGNQFPDFPYIFYFAYNIIFVYP